ncbi:hypothetical protein ACFE04_020527 [Oxalis oulophora]
MGSSHGVKADPTISQSTWMLTRSKRGSVWSLKKIRLDLVEPRLPLDPKVVSNLDFGPAAVFESFSARHLPPEIDLDVLGTARDQLRFSLTIARRDCSKAKVIGQRIWGYTKSSHEKHQKGIHVLATGVQDLGVLGRGKAIMVFEHMKDNKDVVSWNTMVTGYSQVDRFEEALALFQEIK